MTDGGIDRQTDRKPPADSARGVRVQPVTERTFRTLLALVTALFVLAAAGQLVLSGQLRLVVQATALFVCGVASTVFAVIGIVRTRGVDRRWRLLVAAGPLSALPGAFEWTRQYSSGNPLQLQLTASESLFLIAPLLTIAGLICVPARADDVPTRAPPPPTGGWWLRYSHAVIALDSLMIVLSMIMIAWFAALRDITHSGISGTSFVIAVSFTLTSALLVVVLVLVATFRQPRNGRAVALLGAGLVVLAASETVLVQLSLPDPVGLEGSGPTWLGAALAPLLVALAMIAPERGGRPLVPPAVRPATSRSIWSGRAVRNWLHAYLPYLPLGVAAALVLASALRDGALHGPPLYLATCLVTLVSLRQIVIIAENRRLVSDVQRAHQRLEYQAYHDGLTGLANRVLFTRELEKAVTAHSQHRTPVVVLFCDIDHFKTVNDTYGHSAGDELLRTVAARLRTAIRHDDLAARVGGDEFAVLLAGTSTEASPHVVGEQCAQRIAVGMLRPVTLGGRPRQIQISIGLAIADGWQPSTSAGQLLHQADTGMYSAKRRRAKNRQGASSAGRR
ncbi:GGDEF domain-containing protein [Frankia sp. Cpl3]|uniref:diguanylate cyclase n=1 Tax=Parafrankia colletiae TaxID=573497 RepID=UPI000AE27C6D|nr:diguanylate cyclase [Parafrankia colletiae]MCK9901677.1 GGDEF domain-containing protein [Frankia sp. Cpl3]